MKEFRFASHDSNRPHFNVRQRFIELGVIAHLQENGEELIRYPYSLTPIHRKRSRKVETMVIKRLSQTVEILNIKDHENRG